MLATFWTWLCGIFTINKIGILMKILFKTTASVIALEILDKDNQQAAFDFVKELAKNEDLTNFEKAKIFNRKMLEWAQKHNKILRESVINVLRELAVNAIKAQRGL